MLIPIYSDVIKYHWPIGTAILIVLNVVGFIVQMNFARLEWVEVPMEQVGEQFLEELDEVIPEDVDTIVLPLPEYRHYALQFGVGMKPLQWLTAMFMHGDVGHLLGNLLFLWVFGLVIEGRLGTQLFLPLYLLMGLLQNAICQVIFSGSGPGVALGASGAIYSLMAVAVWVSPKVTIKFFYFIWFLILSTGFVDIPVLILAIAYLGLDGFQIMNSENALSTGMLHVMGATTGLIVGFVIVWRKWVFTENEDLISLIQDARGIELKKQKRPLTKSELAAKKALADERENQRKVMRKSLDMHLAAGNVTAAVTLSRQLKSQIPNWNWTEEQMILVINAYQKSGNFEEAVKYCELYLSVFDKRAVVVALAAANLLVSKLAQPRKALKVLKSIEGKIQSDAHRQAVVKIIAHANKQIANNDLELG